MKMNTLQTWHIESNVGRIVYGLEKIMERFHRVLDYDVNTLWERLVLIDGHLELAHVLVTVVLARPSRRAVVERLLELSWCHEYLGRYLVNDDLPTSLFFQRFHGVNRVVYSFAVALTTFQDELIFQFEAGVMLDRQEVRLVLTVTEIAGVRGIYDLVNLGRLKTHAGDLDEIEELIENFRVTVLDVALVLCFDVLKHWLDRVPVCISYQTWANTSFFKLLNEADLILALP